MNNHITRPEDFLVISSIILEGEGEEPWHDDEIGRSVEPHALEWYLGKLASEQQGNAVNIWPYNLKKRQKTTARWNKGRQLLELAEWFEKNGIKVISVYSDHEHFLAPEVVKELGQRRSGFYLGENIGEYLNDYLDGSIDAKEGPFGNLREARDFFLNNFLRPRIDKLKRMGCPRVFATHYHAFANYELAAGMDFPMAEVPIPYMGDVAYSASEMRGACRKWDIPHWGEYLAHESYTTSIPYEAQQKYSLLKAMLYFTWMNGASAVALESGNFEARAGNWTKDSHECRGYSHAICRRYREEVKNFYTFTKEQQRDPSGPLIRFCFALGNLDGFYGQRKYVSTDEKFYQQREPVWGMYTKARGNNKYLMGDPEKGWDIMFKTVYPQNPNALAPYRNHFLAGSPFGAADVILVDDKVADELLATYNLLVYTGWNTMEPAIYRKLIQYVNGGGTLLMAIPHLSTRADREYWDYSANDLINGGELGDLFGIRVIGKGNAPCYNSSRASPWPDKPYPFFPDYDPEQESGFAAQSLSDIRLNAWMADVEIGPGAEVLFALDVRSSWHNRPRVRPDKPTLIRRKLGKGYAYLVTTWEYPGAIGMRSFYTHILKNLLCAHRGPDAHINDIGLGHPASECANIFFTVYQKTVYLLNVDCVKQHAIELKLGGRTQQIILNPCEFQTIPR